ncbi:MAG: hypothetical protein ACI4ME_01555, partial [Aristaeellaceae bacterium]
DGQITVAAHDDGNLLHCIFLLIFFAGTPRKRARPVFHQNVLMLSSPEIKKDTRLPMTDNHLLAGHDGASFVTLSGRADQAPRENITRLFYSIQRRMSRIFRTFLSKSRLSFRFIAASAVR